MNGYIRKIPDGKRFGFIVADTGLDNIFLHEDSYYGSWDELVKRVNDRTQRIQVVFELQEGKKGPRATKCSIKENE